MHSGSRLHAVLEWLYEHVPLLGPLMSRVNRAVMTPTFVGWGMLNYHALPWDDDEWDHFPRASDHVRTAFEHGLKTDTGVTAENADTLMWRHWIVAFCVRHASQSAVAPLVMVECGVGDGLSAFFAGAEAEHLMIDYRLHCYDIWGEIATDVNATSFGGLSLDRTRRNLRGLDVTYHPGVIPSTLDDTAPEKIAYLSIDLNSASATLDALNFFVPRLAPHGVVLFDDYGHRPYDETRHAVDQFFAGRVGSLLKLPTGQAIWFS